MKEAWLSHQRQPSLRTPLEPLSPNAPRQAWKMWGQEQCQ